MYGWRGFMGVVGGCVVGLVFVGLWVLWVSVLLVWFLWVYGVYGLCGCCR